MKSGLLYTQTYWITCFQTLWRGPGTLKKNLDLPLEKGVRRSQWFVAWSAFLLFIGFLADNPVFLQHRILGAAAGSGKATSMAPLLWLTLFIIAVPSGYGLFRLFTLLNHVMIINVFKARGQRLRLLNEETTLISLTPVVTVALIVGHFSIPGEITLLSLILLYILVLLGYSFNLVFHKQGIHGLMLVLGSYAVTWFVLLMGGLAVTVTIAVIAFLALAILRTFTHHA